MSSFDRDVWLERARGRRDRALASSRRRSDARLQHERDVAAIDSMETIVAWCSERGVDVDFVRLNSSGLYDPEDRSILICANALPETQMHFLLHECGHYLIAKCGEKSVRSSQPAQLAEDPRSLVNKLDTVSEEFEAWRRGEKLARRLKVTLDAERYSKHKARAVASYCEWMVAKRK